MFGKVASLFAELVRDFHAWRRNERRVAPRGLRGRVYERKDGSTAAEDPFNNIRVKAGPQATLEITIARADGSVERRVVPASVVEVKDG